MTPVDGSDQPMSLSVYPGDSAVFDGIPSAFDATIDRVFSVPALVDNDADCVVCTGTEAMAVLAAVRAEHRTPVVVVDESDDVMLASRVSEYPDTHYVPAGRLDDPDYDLVAAVTDLVERWRAVADSRRKLMALESAREGIGILDGEGKYVYANRSYAAKYGYEATDILGEHWQMLYPSEEVTRFEEEILPVLEREGTWTGTAIGRRVDGEEFPEELSLAMLDDGGHVCVLRDITDRQQREERLQVLDRVLRHNLRNKMSIIQGHVGDALEATTDPAVREPLETARLEGSELLALARKARTFHRLLDRATLDHAPIDLNQFTADAVASIAASGVPIEFEVGPDVVAVEADPALLESVLAEVVEVLVEATDDGTTVTVTVTADDTSTDIWAVAPDASLPSYEFAVVDRGKETPLYHGEGIGLWFVRWATVLMGGHVDFDSAAEGVRISLPRADEDGSDPSDESD